jgi:DNA topoisomerase-1
MLEFGEALPKIRATLEADLRLRGAPKRKVLAVVVSLLDRTLIRVGNEEYARQNHSYGLTTMLNRHVSIEGSSIRFKFLGKSRIRHTIEVHDRRLAKIVARIEELPGQELFHYVDDDGATHPVSSSDVNAYLQEIAGEHFTAKDFRTWWGTVLALVELSQQETPASERAGQQTIRDAVRSVAARLGNTPAICRKCYIHPQIFDAFREGCLPPSASASGVDLCDAEAAVVCILQKTLEHSSAA